MNDRVNPYAKGMMGEDRATEYLTQRGMVLLERRYRSPYGEIDLIMKQDNMLVFVEVKTRERGLKGDGLAAVTKGKQKRLAQTALCYMGQHGQELSMRFDVVEITPHGIEHIANAFEVAEGMLQGTQ